MQKNGGRPPVNRGPIFYYGRNEKDNKGVQTGLPFSAPFFSEFVGPAAQLRGRAPCKSVTAICFLHVAIFAI